MTWTNSVLASLCKPFVYSRAVHNGTLYTLYTKSCIWVAITFALTHFFSIFSTIIKKKHDCPLNTDSGMMLVVVPGNEHYISVVGCNFGWNGHSRNVIVYSGLFCNTVSHKIYIHLHTYIYISENKEKWQVC